MSKLPMLKADSLENGRLISDVIDICDGKNLPGFIVTRDIEKAFDTLDHSFLILVLKKSGFGRKACNFM